MSNDRILLIDDDKAFLSVYGKILTKKGYTVFTEFNPELALKRVLDHQIDIAIVDMYMPKVNGLEVIRRLKNVTPETEAIVITGNASIDDAVEAIREGAFAYIRKPINIEELVLNIQKASNKLGLCKENRYLRDELLNKNGAFIGKSEPILCIKDIISKIAQTDSSILITGESGTGKEIIAREIHAKSMRSQEVMLKVNCNALSESILESELFGHEKGAFTGAIKEKLGLFERVNRGTLFFDEVGDMPLSIQVKLLRVLQEREFERVGGSKTIKTDFRLICATNKVIPEEIAKENFREDLYYRINIIPLEIPPLREREGDVLLLFSYFNTILSEDMGKNPLKLTLDAQRALCHYSWPGNVRELRNLVERLLVLSGGRTLNSNDLQKYMSGIEISSKAPTDYRTSKEEFEIQYITQILSMHNYNITKAAEYMGIARKNLQEKIRKHRIKENLPSTFRD